MIIPLCDIPCWLNQASAKIVHFCKNCGTWHKDNFSNLDQYRRWT